MEVKLGTIPDGWMSTPLGQLCGRITTGKLDANAMVADGDYPFFTCAKESYRINRYAFDCEALLVSGNGANVGYVHYHKGKFNAYQRTYVISDFSADVHFLKLFLDRNIQDRIRVEVNAGNTPYITMGTLTEMGVVLPKNPAEQRAVAEALSDVEGLLGGLDRLITKKRDLKQAAMQQLLTGQTRLPGFQDEWEVNRLGDHVKFLRNGVNSRAELRPEGRVKYLHYGDVHACKDVCLSPASLPCLPDAKAASLDRLRDGDLIFADASEDLAGVSKSVEMRGVGSTEVVSGLHTIAARFEKKVLADGFKGFLQFSPPFATHLRRLAAGTKVYATNRAHVASVEMRLPTLPEQTAIAGVLSDMEDELIVLEARRDKTRDLKQAMMQELLTGKTRLVPVRAAHA